MKRTIFSSALAIGLVPVLLGAPSASADFVHKAFACPVTNANILPPGTRFDISDIILSSNANTNVTILMNPPNVKLMVVYLKGRETIVTNFQGQVDANEEQALKVTCTGAVNLSVTVVGSGNL